MKYLVTGGAGYIGSHTTQQLLESGHDVVVLDSLATGFKWAVLPPAKLVVGDVGDAKFVDGLLRDEKFDGVLHFAASTVVPESVEQPVKYYKNNTMGSLNLFEICAARGVRNLIFSSTASLYGNETGGPSKESDIVAPENPYARSKHMSETMLEDVARASGTLKYVILRYFNVAGADVNGRLGQASKTATHLIKIASQAVIGQRDKIQIFGTDYPTPDGTGLRDYIHVNDLAAAHVSALDYLENGGESNLFNVGYGRGYSVREVLETVQKVAGMRLNIQETARRAGDPPILIANTEKVLSHLEWRPRYSDLELICRSAIEWERKLARPN